MSLMENTVSNDYDYYDYEEDIDWEELASKLGNCCLFLKYCASIHCGLIFTDSSFFLIWYLMISISN